MRPGNLFHRARRVAARNRPGGGGKGRSHRPRKRTKTFIGLVVGAIAVVLLLLAGGLTYTIHNVTGGQIMNIVGTPTEVRQIEGFTKGMLAAQPPLFTRVLGGPGTAFRQFARPHGLAVDGAGNVYIADTFNHRIQKHGFGGAPNRMWGTRGTGPGQLNVPTGVAANGAGNVYVSEMGNNRIQMFDSNGKHIRMWAVATPTDVEVDGVVNG